MGVSNMKDGLTHEEIIIACRNIGINLECGGCAENFYTGFNDLSPHNHYCTRKYVLKITPNVFPPNYKRFFDFIESDKGDQLLTRATKGELTFKYAFDILRAENVLPQDSAKRIWAILLSLFHGIGEISTRSWNAFLRGRGLKVNR
jgi:hypothetical protein